MPGSQASGCVKEVKGTFDLVVYLKNQGSDTDNNSFVFQYWINGLGTILDLYENMN